MRRCEQPECTNKLYCKGMCMKHYMRKFNAENPGYGAEYARKRRAEKLHLGALYKRQYGITVKNYDEMLAAQNGKCLGCGAEQGDGHSRLHVDHCHTTGKIRGLLCGRCNRGLGMVKDDPKILQNLIEYLKRTA